MHKVGEKWTNREREGLVKFARVGEVVNTQNHPAIIKWLKKYNLGYVTFKETLKTGKVMIRKYIKEEDFEKVKEYREKELAERKGSQVGEPKDMEHMKDDPWINLAFAIVRETIKDYRKALKKKDKGKIQALENTLRSNYIDTITMSNIDVEVVIKKLRSQEGYEDEQAC